jgi:kynurenine 3-monooxygenase
VKLNPKLWLLLELVENELGAPPKLTKPNTDAIAKMALENYQEMREAVLDPEYRRKKKEAEELEKKDRNFIPRYSAVMFHPEIPYSDARKI